jgi:hypothetical protein
MADIQIDAQYNGEAATVQNHELDLFLVSLGDAQLTLNWDHGKQIYNGLREFFDFSEYAAPQVPGDMALVPREATPEMVAAGAKVLSASFGLQFAYTAMLSAAPPLNELLGQTEEFNLNEVSGNPGQLASLEQRGIVAWLQWLVETVVADGAYADIGQKDVDRVRAFRREFESALVAQPPPEVVAVAELPIGSIDPRHLVLMKGRNGTFSGNIIRVGDAMQPGDTLLYTTPRPGVDVGKLREFVDELRRDASGGEGYSYTTYEEGRIAETRHCAHRLTEIIDTAAPGVGNGRS